MKKGNYFKNISNLNVYIFFALATIVCSLSFVKQQYAATPQQGECRCESANNNASGQNGIECYGLIYGDQWLHDHYCAANEVCTGPEGSPVCSSANNPIIKCTCNTNNGSTPNNGMDCTPKTGPTMTNYKYCSSNYKCVNDAAGAATCQPLPCTCDHPNTEGAGNNGMQCTDGTHAYCSLLQVCSGNANQASCKQLPCTCDSPDNAVAGKNGFTCGAGVHDFCQSNEVCTGAAQHATCKLSSGTGPPVVVTEPPPPPPPCANMQQGKCLSVSTGFGDWSTDPAGFVQSLFGILLSISGAIAIIIIMIAGFKIVMSQGDPDKIQAAREQLTAAIVGLLFIIFSLIILQIIGVDVLHLPGFSGSGSGTGSGSGGGIVSGNACDGLALNPDCGTANGSGLFCGQNPACGIGGDQGTLYRCTKSGNGYTTSVARVCPNQDCVAQTGQNLPDKCGTGAIIHFGCQANRLCAPQINGPYTTGNCNNAC